MNVFQYSAAEQNTFTQTMASYGYKTFTTFFGDLSIAEWHGRSGVLDTYQNVEKYWGKDIKYFTEFVMALNHKAWRHFDQNPGLSSLYTELYHKACSFVEANFSGDDLHYFYETLD